MNGREQDDEDFDETVANEELAFADEDERLADENDDVERIDNSIGVQGQASTPPGTGA